MNELAAIVREGRAALAQGQPVVLATVVAVRGSAYRRPGARMLVTGEGWRAGSISGGCLEADLTRQAAFLVHGLSVRLQPDSHSSLRPSSHALSVRLQPDSHSSLRPSSHGTSVLRTYDTSEDAGARLGCGGEVDVLLEPLTDTTFLDELALVAEARRTVRVVTSLEGRVGEREVWVDGQLVRSTWSRPKDGVRSFDETVTPAPKLLVVGAGHDAQPVARMAEELGWSVDVYDWRPQLASPGRFPSATVVCAPGPTLSQRLRLEPGVAAVVMAHHLDYDAAALEVLLRDERVGFVGLLGPRHRSAQVVALVESRGGRLLDAQRAKLRAPVGLDLGAEGPSAIALSILSEVQAARAGRSAQPLSSRHEAIDATGT